MKWISYLLVVVLALFSLSSHGSAVERVVSVTYQVTNGLQVANVCMAETMIRYENQPWGLTAIEVTNWETLRCFIAL